MDGREIGEQEGKCRIDGQKKFNFCPFFAFEVFSVRQFPFASILIVEQVTFLQAVFVLILLPAVSFQHNQKF